jgi:hypothetical protein
MLLLKIFAAGLLVLIAAIFFNGLAARLGLWSWYDFLSRFNQQGPAVWSQLHAIDYAWLFLIYPLLLGLSAWWSVKLLNLVQ